MIPALLEDPKKTLTILLWSRRWAFIITEAAPVFTQDLFSLFGLLKVMFVIIIGTILKIMWNFQKRWFFNFTFKELFPEGLLFWSNGLKWSKMVQNGPKWSKWSKMVQMVKNGQKWRA